MADEEAPKDSKEKLPAKHVGALSASGSHAVIVAQPAPVGMALPKVSRRGLVIGGFFGGLGALTLGGVVGLINFMWPRSAQRAAGVFTLEFNANELEPGDKRDVVILQPNKQNPLENYETKIFLVRLTEEQAARSQAPEMAGGYLALSRKCPHLGCTVPYNETFPFADPATGEQVIGWFRCPCHGSTYADTGRRVFGPAPRSMDVFALTIAADGTMAVDIGTQFQGATTLPGNVLRAVFPSQEQAQAPS